MRGPDRHDVRSSSGTARRLGLCLVAAVGLHCAERAPSRQNAARPDDAPATTATALASSPATPPPSPSGPDASRADTASTTADRPRAWATPLEEPGLPNLHRVSEVLFRGAQPTAEGMRSLERLGVRTVVNLRAVHSDRALLAGTALGYEHLSFKPWHAEAEDVVPFLRLATDPARQPVSVHCQHGADRTGMMVALFRVVVQGWSKDEALAEMTGGGFGFHPIWTNLVDFVREADVDALRRAAGVSAP